MAATKRRYLRYRQTRPPVVGPAVNNGWSVGNNGQPQAGHAGPIMAGTRRLAVYRVNGAPALKVVALGSWKR